MENNSEKPMITPEQQSPVTPAAPVGPATYEYSPSTANDANKNLGTILCIISLVCRFALPTVGGIITGITASGDIGGINEAVAGFVSMLTGSGYIASWVLVIVARVKCKDTFSMVLLIIYLVLLALEIIGAILLIVMCVGILKDCNF